MGWKDILLRVYRGISDNRILLVAAGVTFYALLAIFPGIAALISIYSLFADPVSVANHLDTISNVAPGGAIDVLREEMTRLAAGADPAAHDQPRSSVCTRTTSNS
jgi:membrane protein